MRIPGLAGRVYESLGVDVRFLPPGEIFPRWNAGSSTRPNSSGLISTARSALSVPPSITTPLAGTRPRRRASSSSTRPSGRACRRTSRPSSRTPAPHATCISEASCQKNNAEAMDDLIKNQGVIAQPLPIRSCRRCVKPTRKSSPRRLRGIHAPEKVHESYMAYMDKYDKMVRLQRGGLSRQDHQGLTCRPQSNWPTVSMASSMPSAASPPGRHSPSPR